MYGKEVLGISQKGDKYGFVNEIEIRITAGITLVLAISTFFLVMLKGEFNIALFVVGSIWIDFVLKIFVGPEFSLFGSIVRPFIRNNEKLWVGAVQKRFAWIMGLILSTFVIFCLFILNGYLMSESPNIISIMQTISQNIANNKLFVTPMNPAVLACVLCIIFMWFEAVVGYCVGCAMYKSLVSEGIMQEYEGQNCINGACEMKK